MLYGILYFQIYLGQNHRNDLEEGAILINVTSSDYLILHEQYDFPLNDIALIRIPNVTYTDKIRPICLPKDNKDFFENRCATGMSYPRLPWSYHINMNIYNYFVLSSFC